jgi:hypothetical protein
MDMQPVIIKLLNFDIHKKNKMQHNHTQHVKFIELKFAQPILNFRSLSL